MHLNGCGGHRTRCPSGVFQHRVKTYDVDDDDDDDDDDEDEEEGRIRLMIRLGVLVETRKK